VVSVQRGRNMNKETERIILDFLDFYDIDLESDVDLEKTINCGEKITEDAVESFIKILESLRP
jgi:hypothetical protein